MFPGVSGQNGETRIRTGDTTIFSLLDLMSPKLVDLQAIR